MIGIARLSGVLYSTVNNCAGQPAANCRGNMHRRGCRQHSMHSTYGASTELVCASRIQLSAEGAVFSKLAESLLIGRVSQRLERSSTGSVVASVSTAEHDELAAGSGPPAADAAVAGASHTGTCPALAAA